MKILWQCEVCGYVHEGETPPETCPVCGVGAENFSPLKAVTEQEKPAATAWRCTICDYVHQGDQPPEICPLCGAARELFEPVMDQAPAQVSPEPGRCIVIVGGGIAGLSAAEAAREVSPDAEITLLSGEPGLPYYRLNLSRHLAGEVDESSLVIHPRGWYEQRRIKLVQGEAAAVDLKGCEVLLSDGSRLPYDRMVLANGSHPFVPPIPGATRKGVMSFRTLEDARAIISQAVKGTRCACVGGGLLGLETAGALARQGVAVTVLEGFDWLLPRQLPRPAASLLQEHLEGLGMVIRCGVRVEQIVGDERAQAVQLASGEALETDLVVMATGVRPNSYLARQSGLSVKTGVIVDDQMVTSDPNLLAAGDVAEHRGVVYGIWPASYAQGAVAGTNAGGGQASFTGIPRSNQLKVLDVDLFSIGEFSPEDGSSEVLEQPGQGTYQRLVCRDGRLKGAVLYGDTSGASLIKEAVEAGSQVRKSAALMRAFPALRVI